MYRIGPEEFGPIRGLQEGAPGGQSTIRSREEVVDGDELGGCTGRHQQRVHRVRDVDGPSQGFHDRTLEPVPGQIQDSHRYPGIDDGSAWHAARLQAVLPRAGEEGQFVVGRKQRQQRLRHLVRVLADPCSLDERGTIVDQDAHVPGS